MRDPRVNRWISSRGRVCFGAHNVVIHFLFKFIYRIFSHECPTNRIGVHLIFIDHNGILQHIFQLHNPYSFWACSFRFIILEFSEMSPNASACLIRSAISFLFPFQLLQLFFQFRSPRKLKIFLCYSYAVTPFLFSLCIPLIGLPRQFYSFMFFQRFYSLSDVLCLYTFGKCLAGVPDTDIFH